jgi:hypothetical protein
MDFFEFVMDLLDKEWFELVKDLPKNEDVPYPEDITCAVCDGIDSIFEMIDGECENSNAIVFCDGCNLAVHQVFFASS